jgi:hypothetical protein
LQGSHTDRSNPDRPGGQDSVPWGWVASELRAARESQQRTWGGIDNATLGRYLADEASGDERRQVEAALEELPQLRELTDLVRDVLQDFEPVPADLPEVEAGPVVLPLRKLPARRRLVAFVRRRAPLVAAACLVLTLGVAMPRPGAPLAAPGSPVQLGRGTASRTLVLLSGQESGAAAQPAVRSEQQSEVRAGAERYWKGLSYQQRGDLARAEPELSQALAICNRTLGPDDPATVQTRRQLADVYQVALNTAPPPNPYLYAAPSNPYAAELNPVVPARHSSPLSGDDHALSETPPHEKAARAGLSRVRDEKALRVTAVALRDRITRGDARELQASVVTVLAQALAQAKSSGERESLARALGELGPAAAEAVPVLTKCLRKAHDAGERQALLLALGEMGPAARSAVPVLLASLESPCPEARRSAARALVQLGPSARGVVVKRLASKKVAGHGPEERLVREVLHRLSGREGRIGVNDEGRCFSVRALRESTREINSLARARNVEVLVETVPRLEAADCLGRVTSRCWELGKEGVYVLLDREGPAVRVYVTQALRQQGLSAEKLREQLTARLRARDFDRALLEGVHCVWRFERQGKGGK